MSTYAFSDIHGQYDLWLQIKEFIKPTDTLYCLGDCIDRGPDGFTILCEVLNRPHTFLLKGNHEQFLINCKDMFGDIFTNDDINLDIDLWHLNGGGTTIDNISNSHMSNQEILEIIDMVESLPTTLVYENKNGEELLLDHCGYTPTMREFYRPLWDRAHFQDKWPDRDYNNTYIIHGHTPTAAMIYHYHVAVDSFDSYLYKLYNCDYIKFEQLYKPKVLLYGDGHKIDIDMGSFFTNTTVLLDLDTWKEHYFYRREING